MTEQDKETTPDISIQKTDESFALFVCKYGCGERFHVRDGRKMTIVPNFCPICGRKLTFKLGTAGQT